jgi:hypothetical protein
MSGPRTGLRLLRPIEIYELIDDTDSEEARVPSDVSSVKGGSESVPGVSQPQPYFQTASCLKSNSSVSSRMSVRVDQLNRLKANSPAMDTPLLPSE